MRYQTARLIKDRRTFLFVWEEDSNYMNVVEYLRGQKLRGTVRCKSNARDTWKRLVAAGYCTGKINRVGIDSIPASLY